VSPDGVWEAQGDRELRLNAASTSAVPFRTVLLRPTALGTVLLRARTARASGDEPPTMFLPTAAGTFEPFTVVESSIMEPALQAAHPELTTYSVQGRSGASGRLSSTPRGFHGVIVSETGETQLVHRLGDSAVEYVVASDRQQPQPGASQCVSPAAHEQPAVRDGILGAVRAFGVAPASSGATLRTYRVAIGATGEFTQQFGGQAGAFSAITAGINAANAILEKEAAIRLVLVANETDVIYTNPATDPYTPGPDNNDLATMAQENHDTLTTVIGTANYDLGHVFHYGNGLAAQGYAFFGVCTAEWKDIAGTIFWGVTPDHPIGLRTLLHEFGHQFTAYHSFNGTTSICQFSRNPEGAYEPGSGSSIMSYSDLCGAENVPSTSLYNAGALEQIIDYTSTGFGNSCGTPTATGNTPPTMNAGPDYTIPASTPFVLTASGSDADLDPLTFSWEQFDLGNASPPNTDDGTRPLFRVHDPTSSPSRMFPDLPFILSNTSGVGHALPTTNRTLKMRVIARDNRAGGGGVTSDDAILTVHSSAGPFVVTAPNTNLTWTVGTNQNITWNPAATDVAPISVANVRILLSTDNGQTFPTVLVANTPNDGSHSISVPNLTTTTARVKIEAIGNVFFDISNAAFSITPAGGQPNLKIKKVATQPAGGYVTAGGNASIKETTQNLGTGASAISHTKFYWSTNKTFDGGDILLNPATGRQVPVLAPNAVNTATTAVGIPAAGTGAYFLFAVADADNTNAESIESDNVKSAKIYIGPDLVALKVTLSSSNIPPGGSTTVTLETQNKGKVTAAASVAQIFYSADKKLTGADSLIASINLGPLSGGQKVTNNQQVTIPGNAAPGTRYIFVRVDGTTAVVEALETNNDKKVTITVQ
jgi:hypothetical protein